jgi:putative endonuclease
MCYVYVIRSLLHGRFYVGITDKLDRRIKEHNSGKTKSTKAYTPWIFFFAERYSTRQEARNREIFLKSGFGRELVKMYWSGRYP